MLRFEPISSDYCFHRVAISECLSRCFDIEVILHLLRDILSVGDIVGAAPDRPQYSQSRTFLRNAHSIC